MVADQSMNQRVFYPAMEAVQHLGYSTTKPEQLQVLSGIVSGSDAFAVLLTGFGISLCYACLPTVFDLVLPSKGHQLSIVVITMHGVSLRAVACACGEKVMHNVAQ